MTTYGVRILTTRTFYDVITLSGLALTVKEANTNLILISTEIIKIKF